VLPQRESLQHRQGHEDRRREEGLVNAAYQRQDRVPKADQQEQCLQVKEKDGFHTLYHRVLRASHQRSSRLLRRAFVALSVPAYSGGRSFLPERS
jgi:hypothetical protein